MPLVAPATGLLSFWTCGTYGLIYHNVPKRATSPGGKALSLALEARTTSRVTILVGRGSEDDLD